MLIPVIVCLLVLCVFLFLLNIKMGRLFRLERGERAAGRDNAAGGGLSRCPLCGRDLPDKKKLFTAVYPGEGERLVYIYGCPACYKKDVKGGGKEKLRPRSCPVCRAPLPQDRFLIGRMGQGPSKPYVRILGCFQCWRG